MLTQTFNTKEPCLDILSDQNVWQFENLKHLPMNHFGRWHLPHSASMASILKYFIYNVDSPLNLFFHFHHGLHWKPVWILTKRCNSSSFQVMDFFRGQNLHRVKQTLQPKCFTILSHTELLSICKTIWCLMGFFIKLVPNSARYNLPSRPREMDPF